MWYLALHVDVGRLLRIVEIVRSNYLGSARQDVRRGLPVFESAQISTRSNDLSRHTMMLSMDEVQKVCTHTYQESGT